MTSSDPFRFRLTLQAPTPLATQYFGLVTITFDVANTSGEVLFLETATLKFQADTGAIPNYVDSSPSLRLGPNQNGQIAVDVRPVPLYKDGTNQFDVRLNYRIEVHDRLGKVLPELHSGFYIIINTPVLSLGDVFISFKQPEDQRLANILERYAKRAGFTPHLFMRNPPVGTDQWKSIEKLIKHSHSMFVVWSRRTEWGDGVGREIELCRKRHMREILLIEEEMDLPGFYHETDCTYKRYDPAEPAHTLSDAVSSLRGQVLDSSRNRPPRNP